MGQSSWYWRFLGNQLTSFVNRLVATQGQKNLEEANRLLAEGKSILIYGNHPNSLATGYFFPMYLQLTSRNMEKSGVVVSYKFVDGRMGISGKIVISMFEQINLKTLPVVQYYDSIPGEAKRRINRENSERSIGFLKSPGGTVLIFPEATRSQTALIKAQPGLGRFAVYADYVLPVVSPYPVWSKLPFLTRLPVKFLPPLDIGKLSSLEDAVGGKAFYDLLTDYLMAWMAFNLPDNRRGYYADMARWFCEPVGGRFQVVYDALMSV